MIHQQKNPRTIEQMKSKALKPKSQSSIDDIKYNVLETEFQTTVKATSLARYICEHFDSFPISIQSRIINTHDYLMLFIPLIDEPPWSRRRNKSNNQSSNGENEIVWEKYIDQEWKEIRPCDLLQITQCEAQCWIAVFYLTCGSAKCNEQYGLNTYRKEQILRIQKFLNEYLMDQIPILVDVTRYLNELSLMSVPDISRSGTSGSGMAMLMEQIDQVRESVLKSCKGKLDQVIEFQIESIFSKLTDATDEDLRLIATIYDAEDSNFAPINSVSTDDTRIYPLVAPLEIITIRISKSDYKTEVMKDFEDVFNLKPCRNNEERIVQTPHGLFKRTKLEIIPLIDSAHLSTSTHNNLKLQANLSFKNIVGVTQFVTDLNFPHETQGSKKTAWFQLGKIEDKLVLQLGFKLHDNEYILEKAFISHATNEKK